LSGAPCPCGVAGQTARSDAPFFIVGCVCSGTTLLRAILRAHLRRCCPEETHIFRWSHPFASRTFRQHYFDIPSDVAEKEPVYRLHRKMDGIAEEEFDALLKQCRTRAELQDRYMALYKERNGLRGRRWFDKSPQDIYGILLLNAFYRQPLFIHLVRNPLAAVASMRASGHFRAHSVVEACNYWLEAVEIFNQFKSGWPRQCLEIKFEQLVRIPETAAARAFEFLGEDPAFCEFDFTRVKRDQRPYRVVLSDEDRDEVLAICGGWMRHYGYRP